MSFLIRILRAFDRRRRLIAIISLITLLGLLSTFKRPEPVQRVEMHFLVGQNAVAQPTIVSEEERYFRWVASEYIVFGVHDWATATAFAEEVSRRMILEGYDDYDVEEVDSNMYAGVTRSRLRLGVVADDKETALDFASIATNLLIEQAGQGIPQLENEPAIIFPLDPIVDSLVAEINQPIADQMSIPIRLVVGILSGFAVAILIDLFDPTIRYRDAVERLQLPILGEIPKP